MAFHYFEFYQQDILNNKIDTKRGTVELDAFVTDIGPFPIRISIRQALARVLGIAGKWIRATLRLMFDELQSHNR